jgi:hypothetical protein
MWRIGFTQNYISENPSLTSIDREALGCLGVSSINSIVKLSPAYISSTNPCHSRGVSCNALFGLRFFCPFNLVRLMSAFTALFHNISSFVNVRSPRSLTLWRQNFTRPDRLAHLRGEHALGSVTGSSHKKANSGLCFRVIRA